VGGTFLLRQVVHFYSGVYSSECVGDLVSNTTPLNPEDVLTYTKLSGSPWLTLSADGQLSGTPKNADLHNNNFTVRVTDQRGDFDEATMTIYVLGRFTGELGLSDLAAFAGQWLGTGCGVCGGTDLDGDGDNDMQDWAIFAGYWLN
jgi:hypothetical protein